MEQQRKNQQQVQSNDLNIIEILYACLSRWYWFAASLFIALGITTYNIATTQPTYTRYCDVLIKSKDKVQTLDEQMVTFANMGIRTTTDAYNEIYTLRSYETINEVARRLNLKMQYEKIGFFHPTTLYGEELPVTVEFYDLGENEQVSFTMEISPNGNFTIYDFVHTAEEIEHTPISGELSDGIALVESPLGKIIIRKNENSYQTSPMTINVSQIGLEAATAITGGKLSFALKDEESEIITISIHDHSIDRADEILSTLIDVYNKFWIEDKNRAAEGTAKFIEERLEYITEDLEEVDNNISSYKSRNLLPNIATTTSMNMSQNRNNINQLQKLNNDLQSLREILTKLQANTSISKEQPLSATLGATTLNDQITSYNTALIARNEQVQKSSENNPVVKKMDLELKAKREAIIASAKTSIKKTETEIATLEKETKKTIEEISKNPEQTKYLASAEREQTVKEKLYLFLLQKREENQLSQAFTAYKTRVITPPTGSVSPTAPVKRNSYIMALAIGLLLPASVVVIKEIVNTTVRGRKDLDELTIPIIGEIPQIANEKKKIAFLKKKSKNRDEKLSIVVKDGSRNIINEAFRVLRTNIEFMTRDKDVNIIIATSFNPGSGKTFCMMNTAVSLAIKGEKTIIIDGDMRHVSLSQYVSSPAKGISNYLAKDVNDIKDIIITNPTYKNLSVLPVGTIPPNPTELLESPRFAALIEELKKEYKYILIDCPPVDIVADTHIIEKFADRTFFLVRAGLMDRALLAELSNIYSENKLKNLSIILNGVQSEGGRYGYKYSYRYGYHNSYYYGYGDEKRKSKN